MSRALPLLLCLTLVLLGGAKARAEERFDLIVPGQPNLASTASLDAKTLVIVDAEGTRFVYERTPRLDSADGRYVGFFSGVAGQSIRWPVGGRGSMLIGDAAGTAWRAGKQQIQAAAVAGAGGPAVLGPGAAAGGAGTVAPGMLGSGSLAWLSHGPSAIWTAHISPAGKLLFFDGWGEKWKHIPLGLSVPLVPGAPLVIVDDPGVPIPRFVTVDPSGKLIEIVGGTTARAIAPALQFIPGTHLANLRSTAGPSVLAVDARGKIWDIDLVRYRTNVVEGHEGNFPAGAPIATLTEGPTAIAYVVDRHGTLVEYTRAGIWSPPASVAAGFVPGSSIASALLPVFGGAGIVVAAVDWTGRLAIWKKHGTGWTEDPVTSTRLTPGAPLAIGMAPQGPVASAIGVDGNWYAWTYTAAGAWNPVTISPGFVSGAPVLFDPASMTFFTVDMHGHLVAGTYAAAASKWAMYFLVPGVSFTPQLLSRQVIPGDPLPPARVSLDNSGPDELIVQVVDQAVPAQPAELRIPSGSAATVTIERDPGATLEEVYLVPGPLGTLIEQVQRFPIPPQQRYSIVAWSNKVTYQYVDRRKDKPKGAVANFDLKSHVSLGVFPIPPGDLVADGARIDVFREAAQQRNPGAVLFFPRPAAPPIQFEAKADSPAK